MSVSTLPVPKCTMSDALDKLEYATVALDSGRFTLAHIMGELPAGASEVHIIQCVILTLAQAAEDLETGLTRISFECKAFKAWEAKNANPAGEARS